MRIPRSYSLFRVRNQSALWNLITRVLEIHAAQFVLFIRGVLRMRKAPFLGLLLSTVSDASAASFDPFGTLFTPPGSENKEGDGSLGEAELAIHFQQVFPSTFFSDLPVGGAWLQNFYLRNDTVIVTGRDGVLTDTQISFSTTKIDPTSLSPVFAQNIGADNSIFFPRTAAINVNSGGANPPGGPQAFGLGVQADGLGRSTKGFYYDPSKGNLLLDIQGFHIDTFEDKRWRFDSVTMPGNSVAYSRFPSDGKQGALRSDGLVVLFQFAIPEPSTLAMLGLGLCGGVVIARRNMPRTKNSVARNENNRVA